MDFAKVPNAWWVLGDGFTGSRELARVTQMKYNTVQYITHVSVEMCIYLTEYTLVCAASPTQLIMLIMYKD
jgi:hypothetical protein